MGKPHPIKDLRRTDWPPPSKKEICQKTALGLNLQLSPAFLPHQILDSPRLHYHVSQFLKISLSISIYLSTYLHTYLCISFWFCFSGEHWLITPRFSLFTHPQPLTTRSPNSLVSPLYYLQNQSLFPTHTIPSTPSSYPDHCTLHITRLCLPTTLGTCGTCVKCWQTGSWELDFA